MIFIPWSVCSHFFLRLIFATGAILLNKGFIIAFVLRADRRVYILWLNVPYEGVDVCVAGEYDEELAEPDELGLVQRQSLISFKDIESKGLPLVNPAKVYIEDSYIFSAKMHCCESHQLDVEHLLLHHFCHPMEQCNMVWVITDSTIIKGDNKTDFACCTINSLLILAPFRHMICNQLRCPFLIHTVLQLRVVDHCRCLLESKSFTATLKFFLTGATKSLCISIRQTNQE